jgi:DNA-binding NtrC family response regulator
MSEKEPLANVNILLFHGDEDSRLIVGSILRRKGAVVEVADAIVTVPLLLAVRSYDLLITSIIHQAPSPVDGIDLVREIVEVNPRQNVLIYSAMKKKDAEEYFGGKFPDQVRYLDAPAPIDIRAESIKSIVPGKGH